MLKRYYCRRAPSLRMGSSIKFVDGYYQTDVEYEQSLIESNDWYGCHIMGIPAPAGVTMPGAIPEPVASAPVLAEDDRATFSSLPVDSVDFEFDEPADPQPTTHKEYKPINQLTATDINGLRRPDLVTVARELGLETGVNLTRLKSSIKRKLGV